jgi:hypothetical protein
MVSVSGRSGEATASRIGRRFSQEIMSENAVARDAEVLAVHVLVKIANFQLRADFVALQAQLCLGQVDIGLA